MAPIVMEFQKPIPEGVNKKAVAFKAYKLLEQAIVHKKGRLADEMKRQNTVENTLLVFQAMSFISQVGGLEFCEKRLRSLVPSVSAISLEFSISEILSPLLRSFDFGEKLGEFPECGFLHPKGEILESTRGFFPDGRSRPAFRRLPPDFFKKFLERAGDSDILTGNGSKPFAPEIDESFDGPAVEEPKPARLPAGLILQLKKNIIAEARRDRKRLVIAESDLLMKSTRDLLFPGKIDVRSDENPSEKNK